MNNILQRQLFSMNKWEILTVIISLVLIFGGTMFWSGIAIDTFFLTLEPDSITDNNGLTLEAKYNVRSKRIGSKFVLEFNDVNSCLQLTTSQGTSMKPTADEKSHSLNDNCYTPEMIDIGDVIVFMADKDNKKRIAHRVIEINLEKRQFKTKGDNNDISDGWIDFNQLVAKVVTNIDSYDYVEVEPKEEPEEDVNKIVPKSDVNFLIGSTGSIIANPTTPRIIIGGEPRIILESDDGWLVSRDSNNFVWTPRIYWIPSKYYDLNTLTEKELVFVLRDSNSTEESIQ